MLTLRYWLLCWGLVSDKGCKGYKGCKGGKGYKGYKGYKGEKQKAKGEILWLRIIHEMERAFVNY